MLEVSESMLAERRRLGLDGHDEMWDGELHMVPPPSHAHQSLGSRLLAAMLGAADERGLLLTYETGLFVDSNDFRVPDLVLARPDQRIDAGATGALLVVEIRSPGDETDAKMPWYAARGVEEVLIVDPSSRRVELFVLDGDRLVAATAQDDGSVVVSSLAVTLSTRDVEGRPRLVVADEHGAETLI